MGFFKCKIMETLNDILNKILYERLNKGKNSVITHGLCDCRGLTNRGELSSELSSCSGCSL